MSRAELYTCGRRERGRGNRCRGGIRRRVVRRAGMSHSPRWAATRRPTRRVTGLPARAWRGACLSSKIQTVAPHRRVGAHTRRGTTRRGTIRRGSAARSHRRHPTAAPPPVVGSAQCRRGPPVSWLPSRSGGGGYDAGRGLSCPAGRAGGGGGGGGKKEGHSRSRPPGCPSPARAPRRISSTSRTRRAGSGHCHARPMGGCVTHAGKTDAAAAGQARATRQTASLCNKHSGFQDRHDAPTGSQTAHFSSCTNATRVPAPPAPGTTGRPTNHPLPPPPYR